MNNPTPGSLSAEDLAAIRSIAATLQAAGADIWYDADDPGLTDAVREALRRYAALEDGASAERLAALKAAYSQAAQGGSLPLP